MVSRLPASRILPVLLTAIYSQLGEFRAQIRLHTGEFFQITGGTAIASSEAPIC